MAWEIVDESDPLGPTRYVAEGMSGELIEIRVYRVGCASWRLGIYPNLDAARAGIEAFIVEKTRIRAEQQREGQVQ